MGALMLVIGLGGGIRPAGASVVSLEYRTQGPTADFKLPMGEREIRFKKEPAYKGTEIVRSLLPVSPDPKDVLGFACDTEESTLYLDLNRNLDLTDDPDGVVKAMGSGWGRSFENVVVTIEQEGRRRELVMDLESYGSRWGRYTVKSSWGADAVRIGDRIYQVGVIDNGDGVITVEDTLYLQPAAGEFEAVDAESAGDEDERVEIQAPSTLVLDGVPYRLAYELAEDGRSLALSLEPGAEDSLAEVELSGEGIQRIVLQDKATAAVILAPGQALRIPAGNYRAELQVRMGSDEKHSLWNAWNVPLQAGREGSGIWRAGGPITSKLSCRRFGARLRFDQATVGAAGEKYREAGFHGISGGRPKLQVKKAGVIVHVGEFEYG